MKITKDFIKKNRFSRSGDLIEIVMAIVIHWVGKPGSSDTATKVYFERLEDQKGPWQEYWKQLQYYRANGGEEPPKPYLRYASTQFIIDSDSITQIMPEMEIAHHVGAEIYTARAASLFGSHYTDNDPLTPNYVTIGIELCHEDWEGRFHKNTLAQAEWLVAQLMLRHKLNYSFQIIRHYDVTGKLCPKWFIEHPTDWSRFKTNVLKNLFALKMQEAKLKEY